MVVLFEWVGEWYWVGGRVFGCFCLAVFGCLGLLVGRVGVWVGWEGVLIGLVGQTVPVLGLLIGLVDWMGGLVGDGRGR